jgi:type II secretion system protein C
MKRKMYLAICAIGLFVCVSAGAFIFMLTTQPPAGSGCSASSENLTEKERAASHGAATGHSPFVKLQEERKQNTISSIMNLLQISRSERLFGSYQLKGIVIIDDKAPETRHAVITDPASGITRTFPLHSVLPDDSELVGIEQHHVILQKSGVRKRLDMYAVTGENAVSQRSYLAKAENGYNKIGNNNYVMNPYLVFRGDAGSVFDFAMTVYSPNGDMEGIQLSNMKNNIAARELGLRENDIIVSVNNTSIDTVASAVKACRNAHESDEIQLEIRRGEEVISLTYHLFWEGEGSWTPMDVINLKPVSSFLRNVIVRSLF